MTDPMTPERLAEIEARANVASEGPWIAEYSGEQGDCVIPHDAHSTREAVAVCRLHLRAFDAEFIAHARTDVPALLAEVRRLQAAVERVREMHQDEGQSQGYFPGDRDYGERDRCCGTCGSHGEYGVEWPCPTVAALDGDT